jgi:hypothetical protein
MLIYSFAKIKKKYHSAKHIGIYSAELEDFVKERRTHL